MKANEKRNGNILLAWPKKVSAFLTAGKLDEKPKEYYEFWANYEKIKKWATRKNYTQVFFDEDADAYLKKLKNKFKEKIE